MVPRRRRTLPPWERRNAAPLHPIGRARRRWPRAYDGGSPEPERRSRYRRAFDGGRTEREVRGGGDFRRRSPMMDRLRRNPVRNGLIGLAIAGTTAPLAVARQQQAASKIDPSHEQILQLATGQPLTDEAVANAWRAAESGTAASAEREAAGARAGVVNAQVNRYGISNELAEDIYDIAVEADIDPEMAFGLVQTESEFKNYATSHVGAIGLTQLMPKTAAWLQPGVTTSELRNPETNLRIGFSYLRELIDKYDGDTHLALLAYNRGPGTVDKVLKSGGNPDNGYPDKVMRGG